MLQSGVTQINDGQKQLLGVLNDLQNQMGKLESGLSTSSEGLDKVSGGLKDAQKFLSDFSKSKTTERFYIPQKVLEGKDFREYLDMYMSNDRTLVKMSISGHRPIF
ncbi:putative membrane protein YdgH [compost metagenome]